MFGKSMYFMFRRMLRGYLGMVILVVLPLALISVLGLVTHGGWDDTLDLPLISVVTIINLLAFQLFGGNYTFEFFREDLFSARKWKMYSLPYPPYRHAMSITISCSIFSALQGFTIVLYTYFVYGVQWGNFVWIAAMLLFFSTIMQLVYMLIAMAVKTVKAGERLGEIFGLGSIALAGVWFPMPDNGFFNFVTVYGNPLSLGRNIILQIMTGRYPVEARTSILILAAAGVIMAVAAVRLGRRKLA